ncbi:MAG: hybrid sensor histidine kinase/response regulator, partial [Myxococcota bacterium]
LICDLMMPEIDGIRFYEIVQERWPDLAPRIMFCSGGAFTDQAKDFIGRVGETNLIVEKPIRQQVLLKTVDQAIERHGKRRQRD